jgi:hypothetical protein
MMRGLASVFLLGVALLALAMLVACTKYVPVEADVPKLTPPAECFAPVEKVRPMKPIPRDAEQRTVVCGAEPLAVCAAKLWAKHDLARAAVERRAEQRRQICEAFIKKI